ncbi:MAG: DUF1517 domain-containing protein [Sandaracinus sp.]
MRSISVHARLAALALVLGLALLGTPRRAALAQESGGSFGGSSWDDEPSGGGGGGSSDWGGGSSGQDDWAAREAERRAEDERRAEEDRRREEERRAEEARRAEEERRRREEEERIARERARKLALPPRDRARELPWPATPAPLAASASAGLDAPLSSASSPGSTWVSHELVAALEPPPSHYVDAPLETAAMFFCGAPLLVVLAPLGWLLTRKRALAVADDAPAFQGGASRPSAPRAMTSTPAATPSAWRGGVAPSLPVAMAASASRAMRVSIAFDWTARASLQAALRAMASRHDLKTRPGLHAALLESAALLTQHAGAARYMSWELATSDAREWLTRRTNDLRARYAQELVRNQSTQEGSPFRARAEEGEGLVVISVLVGSKVPIPPPPGTVDASSLAAALRALVARQSGETLALEVVWSPADDNDRMSSYELEQRYPELQRVSDGVGRVACAYCRAPFPRELGRCPSCGGPVG